MRTPLATAICCVLVSFAAIAPVRAQAPAAVGKDGVPFRNWVWDVRQFDTDLVRLVKTTYLERDVKFVLEFRRDMTLQDTEWTGSRAQCVVVDRDGNTLLIRSPLGNRAEGRPPFLIRFEDEDGVTILSERPRYEGDLIGLQGQRIRFVLPLSYRTPDEIRELTRRTKRVAVVKLCGIY